MKRIPLGPLVVMFFGLVSSRAFAQELDLDVSQHCRDHLSSRFEGLDCDAIPPFEFSQPTRDGNQWKIRFHFGFSRTQYSPTDLQIQQGGARVVVRNVAFVERTSAGFYNPQNWEHPMDALRWIDEPSNTFMLSFEKGADVYYITVYHPKYLKDFLYRKTDLNGQNVVEITPLDGAPAEIPQGYSHVYLGNTYRNMVWQVGYGRKFQIFDAHKRGQLYYVPRVEFGIATGAAETSITSSDGERQEFTSRWGFEGKTATFGQRLQYDRGRTSVFIDHRVIFSDRHHGFLDGDVSYNLRMTPITVGVGIELFPRKAKEQNGPRL